MRTWTSTFGHSRYILSVFRWTSSWTLFWLGRWIASRGWIFDLSRKARFQHDFPYIYIRKTRKPVMKYILLAIYCDNSKVLVPSAHSGKASERTADIQAAAASGNCSMLVSRLKGTMVVMNYLPDHSPCIWRDNGFNKWSTKLREQANYPSLEPLLVANM